MFHSRMWPVTPVFTGHIHTMPSCYDRLCRPKTLRRAWKKLNKSNKFSHGFDNETIQKFKDRLDENIEKISKKLKAKEYSFVPLRAKSIPKEGGGVRILRIPAVRDRVVLSALKMLISPSFRKFDRPCSHGYVPDRSRFTAIGRIRELAAGGNKWVLEADIKKFFDTVPRWVLKEKFVKEIRIASILPIIDQAIDIEVGNREEFNPIEKEFLMAESMCQSKEEAKQAYALSLKILEQKLGLQIHHLGDPGNKTRIFPFSEGFTFLGIEFHGDRVVPARKAVERFRSTIAETLDPAGEDSLLRVLTSLRNRLIGWGDACKPYHSTEIFQELDEHIRVALTRYLRGKGLLQGREELSRKDVRFIGIPSLARFKQRP